MFARRRNKPTIISLLDRTENYPITSSGERHNILHTARLHNIVINSNLAVPRNGTSRAPSPTILPRLHHAAKSLCSVLRSNSGLLCQFLTPHSSLLISTSFLHNTNTPITFGTAISPLKISDTPHTSSMLHIVPMHPQAIAMIL